ncbi:MAG: PilZ domain-containing protein [Candidatus Omnitrophica bacterium]|nr:PilZ domain-containing protein [Candidatus Omnitrophota bacterium]
MVWQERRSSVRHAIELPIRYRVLSESKSPSKTSFSSGCKTRNISDTGLLFLSSERFDVGDLLELTLPVRDRIFSIEGCVVYASRDVESGFFRTGIYFPKPDSIFKVKMAEQLHQIEQYRKTLSHEEGRVVSEEEAAHRWIDEHSDEFSKFYKT